MTRETTGPGPGSQPGRRVVPGSGSVMCPAPGSHSWEARRPLAGGARSSSLVARTEALVPIFVPTRGRDTGHAGSPDPAVASAAVADPLTVAEAVAALGEAAPWGKAFGWDPVGLQVGDPAAPVRRAAVCHEVTGPVLERLASDPPDLVVTYHPLLFRPTDRLVAGPGPAGRAWRLARLGVNLVVAHTSFDVAAGGTADALADALGLSGIRGFGPAWGPESVKVATFVTAAHADAVTAAMAAAGGGVIGNYTACSFRTAGHGTFFAGAGTDPVTGQAGDLNLEPELRIEMVASASRLDDVVAALVASHPYEEPAYDVYERRGDAGFVGRVGRAPAGSTLGGLAGTVESELGGVLRLAGDPAAPVSSVAVVPGSGSDYAAAARAAGADAMVTGDVSHHRARAATERGLAVIDPGHAATERPGMARLYAAVRKVIDATDDLTGVDIGPWHEGGTWRS